ncbi:MAG: Rdx family protein [Myxococcales bacterium]|nr:Rdx family protein [Myxococcales bacterium]
MVPSVAIGRFGAFLVRVDGRIIFSKQDAGRFPERGEIAALVTALRQT